MICAVCGSEMKFVREKRGYADFVCEKCGHKVYVPTSIKKGE